MVEINIQLVNDNVVSIQMEGHANSNKKGHDLVCAALSAVIVGGAEAIKNDKDYDFKFKDGYAHIIANYDISSDDQIVLNTIKKQLECIERNNKKFVKININ